MIFKYAVQPMCVIAYSCCMHDDARSLTAHAWASTTCVAGDLAQQQCGRTQTRHENEVSLPCQNSECVLFILIGFHDERELRKTDVMTHVRDWVDCVVRLLMQQHYGHTE